MKQNSRMWSSNGETTTYILTVEEVYDEEKRRMDAWRMVWKDTWKPMPLAEKCLVAICCAFVVFRIFKDTWKTMGRLEKEVLMTSLTTICTICTIFFDLMQNQEEPSNTMTAAELLVTFLRGRFMMFLCVYLAGLWIPKCARKALQARVRRLEMAKQISEEESFSRFLRTAIEKLPSGQVCWDDLVGATGSGKVISVGGRREGPMDERRLKNITLHDGLGVVKKLAKATKSPYVRKLTDVVVEVAERIVSRQSIIEEKTHIERMCTTLVWMLQQIGHIEQVAADTSREKCQLHPLDRDAVLREIQNMYEGIHDVMRGIPEGIEEYDSLSVSMQLVWASTYEEGLAKAKKDIERAQDYIVKIVSEVHQVRWDDLVGATGSGKVISVGARRKGPMDERRLKNITLHDVLGVAKELAKAIESPYVRKLTDVLVKVAERIVSRQSIIEDKEWVCTTLVWMLQHIGHIVPVAADAHPRHRDAVLGEIQNMYEGIRDMMRSIEEYDSLGGVVWQLFRASECKQRMEKAKEAIERADANIIAMHRLRCIGSAIAG